MNPLDELAGETPRGRGRGPSRSRSRAYRDVLDEIHALTGIRLMPMA